MAAKKLSAEDSMWRFSFYEGKKWIRVNDILKNTDWSRDTINRRIREGVLVKKKLGARVYVLWDSWLMWTKGS